MIPKLTIIAPNLTSVQIGHVEVFYSYETAVAYRFKGALVRWTRGNTATTSKHLNKIGVGGMLLDPDTFQECLEIILHRAYE